MIYFTELDHLPVYDDKGHYLGRIVDLGIEPGQDPLRVARYFVRTFRGDTVCIPHTQMRSVSVRAAQSRLGEGEGCTDAANAALIRVRKDVLDQQIIDANGHKVVRVNDVEFDIVPDERHADLRIVAVDPSWSAAVRRLLQGLAAKYQIRRIASVFPARSIPWEFVNLIEPDPARRVKLRLTYHRLAKIHPADLADMIRELGREEQRSLVESLDQETAAQAVSEIPTRMQAALLESIPAEKAADIVEAMAPDEAADVLQELPPEASASVLASMQVSEAQEVRELLGFETNTAGGLMTPDILALPEDATVRDASLALREVPIPLESVLMVHLVDRDGRLTGVVPIVRMVVSELDTPLRTLTADPTRSVPAHTDAQEVLGLFRKYGILSLAVVDDGGKLLGAVTVDDALKLASRG
jgi:CBS domain-containing protein